MAWKQDPDDTLGHTYSGFVEKLIGEIDLRLQEVLAEHKDRGLIDAIARIYWDSFWGIKKYNGTSGQWPWLAEFYVFRL